MIEALIAWCNKENPQTESENMVIQYGAELLIENCLKILMLLITGLAIGRGYESIVFMTVFCSIRSQAGGVHAKTGWGCGLCMAIVWGCGMLAVVTIKITICFMLCIAGISTLIVISKVPMTVNRDCYTQDMVFRKKINTLIILLICVLVSILFDEWRTVIMCAVTMEVVTLLPKIH